METVTRETVISAMRGVLDDENGLSKCCAVKALARLDSRDAPSREYLVRQLLDIDPDVRAEAACALGQLGDDGAVRPLLDNLRGDPEGEVRIQAVTALGRIGTRQTVDPLIECLRRGGYPELDSHDDDLDYSASCEIQERALKALGEIADQRAFAPIAKFLENEDVDDLQETGFRVLAHLHHDRATEFLLKQIREGSPRVRRGAARILADQAKGGNCADELQAEFRSVLGRALGDADATVRACAVTALAESSGPSVAGLILPYLSDPSGEVRRTVASVLASFGGPGILDILHPLLEEPDPKLKRLAVEIVGDISDPVSQAPLMRLLADEDADMRYEAVRALGKIGVPDVEGELPKILAEILADRKADPNLRVQAATALAAVTVNTPIPEPGEAEESDAPDAEDILWNAVINDEARVSQAALLALTDLAPDRTEERLEQILRSEYEPEEDAPPEEPAPAAEPLPRELEDLMGDGSPRSSTLAALLDQSEKAKEAATHRPRRRSSRRPHGAGIKVLAARLAGNLAGNVVAPGPDLLQTLSRAANSENIELRREALLSVGRLGGHRNLEILSDALESDESEVRCAALEALAAHDNTAECDSRLTKLLDDPDPFLRKRTLEILGLDHGTATGLQIAKGLKDEDRDVCRTALALLKEQNYEAALKGRVTDLMFAFSGELRTEAAAALKRVGDFSAAPGLLDSLNSEAEEENHWMCIDALAEMYAPEPGQGV